MNRTLLIARREYAAYAKTVGFWLSLLAFPLFAVLGGAIPILMRTSEPVRAVVLIEEGPAAVGLAGSVRDALRADAERRAEAAARAQDAAVKATGIPKEAVEQAEKSQGGGLRESLNRQRLRIVDTPAVLAAAVPGEAQTEAVRELLSADVERDQRIDSVVFLTRDAAGKPSARVWTRRATDDTVEDFVREALKSANRRQVFEGAGIDGAVVTETERFRPEVTAFSPRSASGGEVSFRDRLPGIIGFASAFILWSLILTGASILLNSVMEEKSNKILEVLLSSASATEILAGKVLGVALLTLTVMLVWSGIGAAGLLVSFPDTARDIGSVILEGGMIWYFVAYAVGGYLMYAVLFAAIGAFCETPRDAQTLMGPIMMIMVVPIIVVQMALRTPDAPLVKIMSWIPFFTPFLMPARAPSEPPPVEVFGTMAGMFVTALLMVWVAGRAFRAGALSDVKLSWKSFGGAIRSGGR
ncbi:MAG: ABC transporter permease [Alphaproteobacteria bacterium]|nr:ABC transporter permease [Alphaproteobacteria bacterium]MBU1527246.1 ABC transporter permease [Alphaproteobacteria bacterium]MBU2116622.1 ABC transporter permease [Alphaproteobacteria bacterium]MBU2350333.1 ABC transporter permease [Alphaproteobacteria bacterium]MBU2383485.1 ABC transporter permease [Alphaproteobacteria bacterium]